MQWHKYYTPNPVLRSLRKYREDEVQAVESLKCSASSLKGAIPGRLTLLPGRTPHMLRTGLLLHIGERWPKVIRGPTDVKIPTHLQHFMAVEFAS
jgi:hypothetical protein